jgi:hypothetical protein
VLPLLSAGSPANLAASIGRASGEDSRHDDVTRISLRAVKAHARPPAISSTRAHRSSAPGADSSDIVGTVTTPPCPRAPSSSPRRHEVWISS